MLISEEYRRLNKALHETNDNYGTSGANYRQQVLEIASVIKPDCILDYGCGKATLANSLPQYTFFNYDPCLPPYTERPMRSFPLTVCTDVLEHVEPGMLEEVLDDIRSLSDGVVVFAVSTRPAKKTLADGRNAHLIVKPYTWWVPRLWARWHMDYLITYGGSAFVATVSDKAALKRSEQ